MSSIKDKLINYYHEHLILSVYKIAHPEKKFSLFLENVDDTYLQLIFNSLQKKKIQFCNSCGYTFDYSRKWINADIRKTEKKEPLFHEIGHAVDFIELTKIRKGFRVHYFDKNFSNQIILSNGKTLNETIKSEAKTHAKEIYAEISKRFNEDVISFIPQDLLNKYKYLISLWNEKNYLARRLPRKRFTWDELPSIEEIKKDPLLNISWERYFNSKEEAIKAYERKEQVDLLLGDYKELNQVNKEVHNSKEYKEFHRKYNIIIDMLSGAMKINEDLVFHSYSYFKKNGAYGSEFFAECFAMTICNNSDCYEITKKFLPESINAFEELLQILFKLKNNIS